MAKTTLVLVAALLVAAFVTFLSITLLGPVALRLPGGSGIAAAFIGAYYFRRWEGTMIFLVVGVLTHLLIAHLLGNSN